MDAGHCQICGRVIRCKAGRIAHHGYRRPRFSGFQTRSCEGARWRPYEVACDAIPGAIEGREAVVGRLELMAAAHLAEPPAELHSLDAYRRVRATYKRPEDFDGPACVALPFTASGYSSLYRQRAREFAEDIRGYRAEIEYLTKRLAEWVAPAGEG